MRKIYATNIAPRFGVEFDFHVEPILIVENLRSMSRKQPRRVKDKLFPFSYIGKSVIV
jgi:hypothetical protein